MTPLQRDVNNWNKWRYTRARNMLWWILFLVAVISVVLVLIAHIPTKFFLA